MENDVVGHMVCIVAANDADGDKLWYYVVGESAVSDVSCWHVTKSVSKKTS